MSKYDDAWLSRCLAPLSTGAGDDARDETEHETVRAAIDALTSLHAPEVDWADTLRAGEHVLTTRSKDLLVASCVAYVLGRREGLAGLVTAMRLLAGLLEGFGAQLFPRRVRARANALAWFAERVAALPWPEACPESLVAPLRAAVRALGATTREQLGDDAPALSELARIVDRITFGVASAPAPLPARAHIAEAPTQPPAAELPAPREPAAEPAPPVPASSQPPAAHEPPPVEHAPTHVTDLAAQLVQSGERLAHAASTAFDADLRDPRPYRVLRVAVWLELHAAPASQSDAKCEGRTRVQAPDRRARETLQAMVAAGRWEALLPQCEGMLRRYPLWFDTCHWCAQALAALGPDFEQARAAVEHETRALITRVPALLDLHFVDGSPYASAETRAWLAPRVMHENAATNDASSAFDVALRAALEQGVGQAGGEVDAALRAASSPREAFGLRVRMARVLEDLGRLESAGLVYLGLEREICAHALDGWEPELARDVYTRLWALIARKALAVSAGEAQRVRVNVVRLSPLALV